MKLRNLSILLMLPWLLAFPASGQSTNHLIVPQWQRSILPPSPGPAVNTQGVNISRVAADVCINDLLATTVLTIELQNPGPVAQESAVYLPVPSAATFKEFRIEGNAGKFTAELLPRAQARQIYDDIVRRMIDPGLLEFAGTGLIRSAVFPVPARGSMKVQISYEEMLREENGRIDYLLPRSENRGNGADWSVRLVWNKMGGAGVLYCPSHPAEIRPENDGRVRLATTGPMQAGSFRVTAVPPARDGAAVLGFSAYPPEGNEPGYFLLMVNPPQSKLGKAIPREVSVVFDRSGSMAGGKLDQVKAAALQVIEGLDVGETVNVISYNEGVSRLFPAPRHPDAETLKDVRAYLAGLRPSGGTNIHDAVHAALSQPCASGVLPVVLFLTDGLPTVGETQEKKIRDSVRAANSAGRRIFTFGVGLDVNTPLLAGLASDSRATTGYVLPGEDVEWSVVNLFRRLSGPVWASPELGVREANGQAAIGRVDEIVPAVLPDFFAGDSQVIVGRYSGTGPLEFVLRGQGSDGETSASVRFEPASASTAQSHVPRIWATRRIAVLTEALRAMGSGDGNTLPAADDPKARELVDEIVRLSLRHGVLSEYTAFLARDGMAFGGPERPLPMARENFEKRAMLGRTGAEGMNQEMNIARSKSASVVDKSNRYVDAELREQKADGVRQVGDKTFFNNHGVWTDSMLAGAAKAPSAVSGTASSTLPGVRDVVIGSAEFSHVVDALERTNRQAILGLPGEVVFAIEGQSYRLRKP